MELGSYSGAVVEGDVPFRVFLPGCAIASSQSFPAIYLLHGKPFTESHWDDLGADEAAQAGIASGEWPPFLLVMPRQPEPLFSRSDGGPGSYEQELLEGLIPAIESSYPADPDPGSRAIAGISRGGIWALVIGLGHPEGFERVAALSPALSVNRPRPAYDPFNMLTIASADPPLLWLAAGESDWARWETQRLAQAAESAGIPTTLLMVPGGHDSSTWTSLFDQLFAFLAADW